MQVMKDFLHILYRFAYIEFADKESVENAEALTESLFKGRQIKVGVVTCAEIYMTGNDL